MLSAAFVISVLTFTTLWANSADNKLMIFSYFSQKTVFIISCKMSPMETTDMKCQNLFSGKNKETVLKSHLLKFLPRVLSKYLLNLPSHIKLVGCICVHNHYS